MVLLIVFLNNKENNDSEREAGYDLEYGYNYENEAEEGNIVELDLAQIDIDQVVIDNEVGNLLDLEDNHDINNDLEPIDIEADIEVGPNLNYNEFKEFVKDYKILLNFLNNSFEYIASDSLVAKSPEVFYEAKKGSTVDFAVFSFAILDELKYRPGIMRYEYTDSNNKIRSNFVLVFRAEEGPRHIVFSEEGVFLFEHGWSFEDLIRTEEQRLAVDIDRYLYFVDLKHDLSEPGSIDWVINK